MMELQCDSEDDGYNYIKPETFIQESDTCIDNSGETHCDVSPRYECSITNDREGQVQPRSMDIRLCEQIQDVCLLESAGDAEGKLSRLLTQNSFQASPNTDETHVQPEQILNAPFKPQKSTRLWSINKRIGKKWPGPYSQRPSKQLKCTNCPETFLHKRSLSRHTMIMHGPKVYFWCKRCCRFYNRRDNLRTHYRSHHPKYIKEVDHIEGVKRESLISEGLPSSSKTSVSNSSSSNNMKYGIKPRETQAMQVIEREQGAVGQRQENSRMRATFVHQQKDKTAGKSVPHPTAFSKQTWQRSAPDKQLPTLPVPLVGFCREARRPCAKASTPPTAGSRGNPMTVADVMTYRLQQESNQADEDIVVVSDDSSSDSEPELPHESPQGPRDKSIRKLDRGTPFKDLLIEKVMQGQVTRVSEEHQTFVYSGGEKIRTERRKRVYNVLYLEGVGEETKHTRTAAATSPSLMSDGQLEESVQGRVTKVTETSSKYTYSTGQKVTKEKTSRIYDVMLMAGLANI